MATYLTGNSSANNQATFNRLSGNSFSQYGINTSATDSALGIRFLIEGNQIDGTTFQGIIVGGGLTFSTVADNSIQLAFNNNGAAIIVEGLNGSGGLQSPQHITVTGNHALLGGVGILAQDTLYSSFVGNTISASGIGILFTGISAGDVAYNTVNSNVIQS